MSHVVCIVYSLSRIIKNGRTALMKASSEGHVEVVKVLAEAKANLNITDQVNFMIDYLVALTIHLYYDIILLHIYFLTGW